MSSLSTALMSWRNCCVSSRNMIMLRVRLSVDFPLRWAGDIGGESIYFFRLSDIFSLIHPVIKASQSWFSVIGRLENDSLSLGVETLVWSLVTCGRIWCTRLCWMSRLAVCVHEGGSRARSLSVKLSCRTEPGIVMIWGRIWGIRLAVSSDDIRHQGQCRTERWELVGRNI